MATAPRRIRRKRPMAPPPAYGGGPAGGGFGGANQMAPAVMPPEWNAQPSMGMVTGAMVQPGGPMDQFGGFQGGAQQFGPNSGLLGNIAGGMGGPMAGGMGQPGMPPGQPQQAVMPPMGQPGMGGGAMAGAPPMAQPGMAGGMVQADPQPQYDPGVSAGRLAEAQRLAGLGQMGRAKQQWELGGGAWGGDAHRFLRG